MAIVSCAECGARNRVDEGEAAERQAVCGNCGASLGLAAGAGASGAPVVVTDDNFERAILGADAGSRPGHVYLVDFWAEWCGPCRALAPTLGQLAAESGGRYTVAKLNVDENPRTASQYGIRSIPAMLIFKDGRLVDTLVGNQPKQAIAAKLASHL
jgi:thioredoxin